MWGYHSTSNPDKWGHGFTSRGPTRRFADGKDTIGQYITISPKFTEPNIIRKIFIECLNLNENRELYDDIPNASNYGFYGYSGQMGRCTYYIPMSGHAEYHLKIIVRIRT